MTLASIAAIGADLIALIALVGGLYVRRHSRKDLMAAYIGVNVGVLAVTLLLATSSVGAGLGLGLFGVLSIIRLRSTELAQHEVAYFFAALALGLLGGIGASIATTAVLMALVVASLWIGDHPSMLRRNRHQVVMVDRAISDETALTDHLSACSTPGSTRSRSSASTWSTTPRWSMCATSSTGPAPRLRPAHPPRRLRRASRAPSPHCRPHSPQQKSGTRSCRRLPPTARSANRGTPRQSTRSSADSPLDIG